MLKLAASPSALFNNLTGAVDSLFFSHAEQVVKVLLSNGISDLKACNSQAEASSLVQQATSAASYTVKQRIPGTGVPTVSVAVRGEYVFAAFMDGAVRVHSLADAKLRIELQAHSRYLSAMDVHPSKDIIVTAAEDCTVNVWSISPTLQVKLLFSQCWHNAMITGVIFCGQDSCMLAACAYDTDELKTWQLAM
ncbi:hypothetical protein WJX72_012395 [[Myrmecia] bisecta]|uniref:WD repeat-containing protein 54 beta-propeller domain-containing protein n=1 Tax=[Myrmecia] bisecta TaxID=41462 RepID=A0AAW1PL46_9CHLO